MPDPHLLIKPLSFFETFSRKSGEQGTTHYCPGCGHGIIHKILAEAIDDLEIQDRVILIGSVGCSVFIYYYFETSAVSAPHGRAQAVGTGVSRMYSDAITISYQGDGDLAAIGTSHSLHAANRGENMFVIFVNNNTYGMTGGQLAPTSLLHQKTATSPQGRSLENEGPPIKMAELVASLDRPAFVARGAVNSPKNVRQCRKLIRRALQAQLEKKGYTFLEILAPCPTNWKMAPGDSCDWIDEVVLPEFPLGVLKDTIDERPPVERVLKTTPFETVCEELDLNVSIASDEKPLIRVGLPEGMSELRIKCAGFGGQGVLSLGLAFANIAVRRGLDVTWLPSYGPEMRGGLANCSVVLSETPIGSPIVDRPEVLIALNQPSFSLFGPQVPPRGHIFYNKSMTETIPLGIQAKLHPVAATEIASSLGNIKVGNSVLLGYATRTLGLFTLEEMAQFVQILFPDAPGLRELNNAAIAAGWERGE